MLDLLLWSAFAADPTPEQPKPTPSVASVAEQRPASSPRPGLLGSRKPGTASAPVTERTPTAEAGPPPERASMSKPTSIATKNAKDLDNRTTQSVVRQDVVLSKAVQRYTNPSYRMDPAPTYRVIREFPVSSPPPFYFAPQAMPSFMTGGCAGGNCPN